MPVQPAPMGRGGVATWLAVVGRPLRLLSCGVVRPVLVGYSMSCAYARRVCRVAKRCDLVDGRKDEFQDTPPTFHMRHDGEPEPNMKTGMQGKFIEERDMV